MSRCWLTIPSKRPTDEAEARLSEWAKQGYSIALWLDDVVTWRSWRFLGKVDYIRYGKYPGYAQAVNHLVQYLIADYEDAEWFICAGDDTSPDMTKRADEIADECNEHFAYLADERAYCWQDPLYESLTTNTFGVMQPCGDRWGDGDGAYIDRIAGSPWMGREFCKRAWNGKGPLHPGFWHMHVDEAQKLYAEKLGCYWMRRDLTHYHHHWGRATESKPNPTRNDIPPHLIAVNGREHWMESRALLNQLRETNFAGWEPL